MEVLPTSSPVFMVHRREPEFIAPSKPTPHEFKYLSDIDDRRGHRFRFPAIFFYPNKNDASNMTSTCKRGDPVDVIRKALAKVLVFYYPLAGRLREAPGDKLIVECTGEGIMFIEADADVCLNRLGGGDALKPPFPCLEELLYVPPGYQDFLNSPLLFIQVTRLICGGFIFGVQFNHTIFGGPGLGRFMIALGEIIRGEASPSIPPAWKRHILNARDPPQVTFAHREYDATMSDNNNSLPLLIPQDIDYHYFFFTRKEEGALREQLPVHLQACSAFELLTACLWRCRTVALGSDPKARVRVVMAVDTRWKIDPPLPAGYYGNTMVYPAAVSTTEKLSHNPLGFAVDLVKKAKNEVNGEYIRSTADLMATKGRPIISTEGTYFVSDVRKTPDEKIDLGWGKELYGGCAIDKQCATLWMSSFYMSYRNNKGDEGILVPVGLPRLAMSKFVLEIESMTMIKPSVQDPKTSQLTSLIYRKSAL
ncbi:hypothetical protein C5167_033957 [Papaver somniferum]|uniref:Benzyl alcohol O-benzoyltransferase n=1 Tax=Papaver somniferum TaxID=3469 RepID=A0A4Y7KFU5_PAPSO|nr:benzyl alcohol O-benzoyltransferase-like [Papaver somniferum]RZC70775.1 hypothetical protein C5167_033957 [Papaver somniferum]